MHFDSSELNGDAAPYAVQQNLRDLAKLLETVRMLGGNVPLVITSGYRPGDARQHGSGSAADFRAPGRDPIAFAEKIASGLSPGSFGQLILYPWTTKHVHIALPNGSARGQILVETGVGKYTAWKPGQSVPGWGSGAAQVAAAPNNEGAASLPGLAWLLAIVALTYWILGGRF